MTTPTLKIKKLREDAPELPSYATPGSAGMDLRADLSADWDVRVAPEFRPTITIQPGDRRLVKTGLMMEIPPGYEGQVRPRSGLALAHGITVLNAPGTIDSDYRGEVGVILHNTNTMASVRIRHGDRIAQLVIAKVEQLPIEVVTETSATERGSGGFGSTGVK